MRRRLVPRPRALLVVALVLACAGVVGAATPPPDPVPKLWVTHGAVNATAVSGTTLYVGGEFDYVGPYTGAAIALDATTAEPSADPPLLNNNVRAIVPDGSGGWYVGGDFTRAGEIVRNGLAHIDSDGTVDPGWNPAPDGYVRAIAVSGSTVYVAGSFTTVAAQARDGLAALDAATGAARAWAPQVNDDGVDGLVVSPDGSTVYARGGFTEIGGEERDGLAALDATTGAATGWDPQCDGFVLTFAVSDSGATVFVGGSFAEIGGEERDGLAELDATSGAATGWDPNPDGRTTALAVSGSTVYVGGVFHEVGGEERRALAALDATTGEATGWESEERHRDITTIAVAGSTVYVDGAIEVTRDDLRRQITAVDTTTGEATDWHPRVPDSVFALAATSSDVYVGGDINSVGGVARTNLAAIDIATGRATDWNPAADGGTVQALAANDATVYAGGEFDEAGGEPRARIAAIDAGTGSATGWNPGADDRVRALVLSGSTLYAGGEFTQIGGQPRGGIAALGTVTGTVSDWAPDSDHAVFTLAVSDSTVYAGGVFHAIGGESRGSLAAVDRATGAATAFQADTNGAVRALALSGSTLYVGGGFPMIGGETRDRLAAVDATTGDVSNWAPGAADDDVWALAVAGDAVYAGGGFTAIGGEPRGRIAEIDAATGALSSWDPGAGYDVYALTGHRGVLYAGGGFSVVGATARSGLAALRLDATPPVTSLASFPTSTTTSTGATFAFTVNEPATSECALDGAAWAPCTSPVTFTGLTIGSHAFQARSTDEAGNVEAPVAYTWTIVSATDAPVPPVADTVPPVADTVAPATRITSGPELPSASRRAAFAFVADEAATFTCRLDGRAWTACTSPRIYTRLADGSHRFEVRATDAAGNLDTASARFVWMVDTVAPQTRLTPGPGKSTGGRRAEFSFTADGAARYECRLDGPAWTACASPKIFWKLALGPHAFEVRAIDAAGNAEASPARYTWTIRPRPQRERLRPRRT